MKILQETSKPFSLEGLDEDEKYSREMLYDNSISALAKLAFFQYDGGNLIKDEYIASLLSSYLPIKNDIDEAQEIHSLMFKQLLAQNEVLMKNADAVKGCIQRIQEYASAHTDIDEDILGDEGKKLL